MMYLPALPARAREAAGVFAVAVDDRGRSGSLLTSSAALGGASELGLWPAGLQLALNKTKAITRIAFKEFALEIIVETGIMVGLPPCSAVGMPPA
jgi:hypothetical protein